MLHKSRDDPIKKPRFHNNYEWVFIKRKRASQKYNKTIIAHFLLIFKEKMGCENQILNKDKLF